jgi:hypothetical protein
VQGDRRDVEEARDELREDEVQLRSMKKGAKGLIRGFI